MAMRPIRLLAPMGLGFNKTLLFKWEWAVFYEVNNGNSWYKGEKHFKGRKDARNFIRIRKGVGHIRNLQIKRRLVQTSWETYEL